MDRSKSASLLAALAVVGVSSFAVYKTLKKKSEIVEKHEKKLDEEVKSVDIDQKKDKDEDDRPTSTLYTPKKKGEVVESYDLDMFTRDTYQVGYELTNLLEDDFKDLVPGEDYIRYDGKNLPEKKYYEVKFDGRHRVNFIFHGRESGDEAESIFYSEYLRENLKPEKVRASFSQNDHIVIIKGTYNSFADLAYHRTESTESVVVSKITLGRIRLEDIADMMLLLKSHGFMGVLMY